MRRRPVALLQGLLCAAFTLLHAQQIPPSPDIDPVPAASQAYSRQRTGNAGATTNVDSVEIKTEAPAQLPPAVPAGRRVIGLALEGGGALGLAHIGVLQWLEDNHIPVDRLAGTSMGALVGSLYASGKSPKDITSLAEGVGFDKIFTVAAPYSEIDFRRREDRLAFPEAKIIGLKGGPSFRNALASDGGLNSFLVTNLFLYNSATTNYDQLSIPFRCVSTDLNTMEPVVFRAGPLPQAVRASIAIPGVFAPVEYRGHFLVDGAILDNLPSGIVRQDLHADIVIGVQLDASNFTDSDVSSIVGIFARAYSAGTARNEKISQRSIDVLIHVESGAFSTGDYGKTAPLIALGYAVAEKQRPALQPFALNATDWQAYLKDRASRAQAQPQPLQVADVQGGSPGAQQVARQELQPLLHQPLQPEPILTALRHVEGSGSYQASFETFAASNPATSSPANQVEASAPVDGIKVRLSPVHNGPPFLLFGADLTLENSTVSRSTYDLRLLNTNLGGFGSELRSDVRVGFLTQLSAEYYRLLTPSGFFAEPRAGIVRQPVYLWQNPVRISEHLQQQAGGGLETGRTFSRNLQISATYDVQVVRWHPVSGEDGTAPVSGSAQTALAHIVYDSRHPGEAAETGIRFDLKAGSLFHAVDSRDAPLVEAQVVKRFAPTPNAFFTLSAEANTYFRRNVTEPLRFAMGGPLRLSASSVDEYRGTDDVLTRAAISRRIAPLPLGYGQGLYAGFAYEAAGLWSPEQRAILRQDGVLTLVGVTPLGNLTFGGSAGDAAHRKVFFTFGRLF